MLDAKKVTLPVDRYRQLKQEVEELTFVWQEYERAQPNEWYTFKYQGVMRSFLAHDSSDYLFESVQPARFSSKVKLPLKVYQELVELSDISQELQDVMANPPYGSARLDSLLKKEKT